MRSLRLALLAPVCLAACGGATAETFGRVTARVSRDIGTVILLDVAPPTSATDVWVEYGPTASYGRIAPLRGGEEALLLASGPGDEVYYRAAATVSGGRVEGPTGHVAAGQLSGAFPEFTAVDLDPDAAWGSYVMTSTYDTATGQGQVFLLDRSGQVVWGFVLEDGFVPAARPSRDGQAILYLRYSEVRDSQDAEICRQDLDGEQRTCVQTPYAHHDFVELPDGSYAYTQEVVETWEGYDLVGDALVRRAPDGSTTELWSAFDEIEPVPDDTWGQHHLERGIDWTHANGLAYDEEADRYYISFYYAEEIRKIDPDAGVSEWVLGGAHNQFTFDGPTFGPQHAPQRDGDRLALFDNGTAGAGGSRIATYRLDEDALTATADADWRHPDGRHTNVLGDNHPLPNGYVATAWGDVGELIIASADGEPVWRAAAPPGTNACQVYVADDFATLSPR